MDPFSTPWAKVPGANPLADSRLEPEFHAHYAPYKLDPSPANTSKLLKATAPILDTGIKAFGGAGNANPMLRSRARRIAVDAFAGYDPAQASLKTHLLGHLQGLRRYAAKQTQMISVPEKVAMDKQRLDAAEAEHRDRYGREPSSGEIADATGLSLRRQAYVRGYVPGFAEGQVDALGSDEDGGPPDTAVQTAPAFKQRVEFLYPDLDPINQAIVEHGFGLHGRRKQKVGWIARRLNLTPGAISQRTARIQQMLDELDDTGVL